MAHRSLLDLSSVVRVLLRKPRLKRTHSSLPTFEARAVHPSASIPTIARFASRTSLRQVFPRSTSTMASTQGLLISCRLSQALPTGTIDSHMHIIPPDFDRFPLQSDAQYTPTPHTLAEASHFYREKSGLGIETPRLVLTQVSIYGQDNSALLSGLADLGGNGRGVVECDPKTVTVEQLESWWAQGVRGVRINLVSVGRTMSEAEMVQTLQDYVDKLSQHDLGAQKKWVIEIYMSLKCVPTFLKVLPTINNADRVRWCLDHFGGLKFKDDAPEFDTSDNAYSIPGFGELVELITNQSLPEVYLKMSGQYRMDPEYPSTQALDRLNAVGRELVSKAPDRVIWASDWPHTRFGNVDSLPFVGACYSWCGNDADGQARRDKLFRLNAEKLWDMA